MIKIAEKDTPRLGMGCWAIGGKFTVPSGEQFGYANANNPESKRTLDAAYAHGIRIFDTAPAYGAGHSEVLIGEVLANRDDVIISTKVGRAIDPEKRLLIGDSLDTVAQIESSLKRLKRDYIDLAFLHLNSLSIEEAKSVFDDLQALKERGLLKTYGWSTDFPERALAYADLPDFTAIQHAMNIYFEASKVSKSIADKGLWSFNRSPLAMGVLTGKFQNLAVPEGDIRSNNFEWMSYFQDRKAKDEFKDQLEAVREMLTSGGRTLSQGALCWLLAKNDRTIPLPGARIESQIIENAKALEFGPLKAETMAEIEAKIARPPEGEPRER